jgi:hypothetical protein
LRIGFSDGSIPEGEYVGHCTNSYSITYGFYYDLNKDYCWISGKKHDIEWPEGVIKPEWNEPKIGDVYGCGLLLSPDNELAIFFTLNGILIGQFFLVMNGH